MSNYYVSPIGLCIKTALSTLYYKDYNTKKALYIELNHKALSGFNTTALSTNQKQITMYLMKHKKPILASSLKNKFSNDLALFVGSLAAAQSTESIGNKNTVSKIKILRTLEYLLK